MRLGMPRFYHGYLRQPVTSPPNPSPEREEELEPRQAVSASRLVHGSPFLLGKGVRGLGFRKRYMGSLRLWRVRLTLA
jgi:hypothetical protein